MREKIEGRFVKFGSTFKFTFTGRHFGMVLAIFKLVAIGSNVVAREVCCGNWSAATSSVVSAGKEEQIIG